MERSLWGPVVGRKNMMFFGSDAGGQRAAGLYASMPQGMFAGLMRRNGESWGNLLLRLDEAVVKSVVENRVISDLHV